MRRRLLLAAAAALVALAAAAIVQAASRPAVVRALDPQSLPQLPAQGLVIERSHDVLLVGLDGKPIGSLAGFAGPYTGKTYVLEGLAQADPAAVLLADSAHHPYFLDPAASQLRRLTVMRIPLAGGASLSAHAIPLKKPYLPKIVIQAAKHGRNIGTPSQGLHVVGGRLVVSGGTVFDTLTPAHWRIGSTSESQPGGCAPAGVAGPKLVAVCSAGKYPLLSLRATEISTSGTRHGVGPTMRWGFGARTAFLSPDGRFVGITLAVGCGFPVGAITSTGAGKAGYIANGKPVGSKGAMNSEALGWTTDGKLVAHLIPPTDCENTPRAGIYAVEPATFARKLIFPLPRNAGAIWLWNTAS